MKWFNRKFVCPFWGHVEDNQISWWHDKNDVVTIEATVRHCERCGDEI